MNRTSSKQKYQEEHPNKKHNRISGLGLREKVRAGKISVKEAIATLDQERGVSDRAIDWFRKHKDVDWGQSRAKKEAEAKKAKAKKAKEEAGEV